MKKNKFVRLGLITCLITGLALGGFASASLAGGPEGAFARNLPLTAPVAVDDAYSLSEDTPLLVPPPGVLANDADSDGDPLAAQLVSPPQHAELTLRSDGSFDLMPDENFYGADQFTYIVSDTITQSNLATVFLTVTAVNDPPQAAADLYTLDEGSELSIPAGSGVLANDTDIEGDPLQAILVDPPLHGALTLHSDGSLEYTPDTGYHGADQFTYQADDGVALSEPTTVDLIVWPVNQPPQAVADSYSLAEDSQLIIDPPGVLTNDFDLDGDPLSALLASDVSHGVLTLNPDGSFIYTPLADYNGPDDFVYQACDTASACASAAVSLTITSVNDPPVALDDSASATEDNAVVVNVLANDFDVDGNLDPASVTITTPPAHGLASVDPDNGSITYLPSANYNGPDSLVYQVCDTASACASATVNLLVDLANDPPVALGDTATTLEDVSIALFVLSNDDDVDGNLDPFSLVIVSPAAHGFASVNLGDSSITYTPAPDYNGADSFVYQVCDTTSACASATVSLTIIAVNDPPVANNDTAATPEDLPVTIRVLDNDNDVDGNLDLNSVTVLSAPAHGTASVNPGVGSIVYTPQLNYNGPDSFIYQVCDTEAACASASSSVSISPVNDPPTAGDDTATTPEDEPVAVEVLANDSDVDGNLDPTALAVIVQPAHGSATISPTSGQIRYSPTANYFGVDAFTYQVCDASETCATALVYLTINPVNDPPVLNADFAITSEDTPILLAVLANDIDIDDALNPATLILTDGANHGTTLLNRTDGTIAYTPLLNYHGTDQFEYRICDTAVACGTALVDVTILPANDPPLALSDPYSVLTGETLIESAPGVLDNDSDIDGDALVAVLETPPAQAAAFELNSDGSFTYQPAAGFTGTDQFSYSASDGQASSPVVEVVIEVYDATSPQVKWISPVNDGDIFDVDGTPITLEVTASDDVSISSVHFFRWDALNQVLVTIGTVSAPPYRLEFDTRALNPEWNQVFARAVDSSGNNSGQPWVWLYKLTVYRHSLPLIFR